VADARNNVESVFLPAGVSGAFTVKATATNIAGDGVPGNGFPLDQDFALVVNNGSEGGATPTATPTVTPGPIQLQGKGKRVAGISTSRLNRNSESPA
jgi:hypothetical protein